MTTFIPRTFLPLPAAAQVLRDKHRDALRQLSEWSLGVGRPIDPHIAAICMGAFDDYVQDDRVLTRPLVNGLQWGTIHNEATILNVVLPADWPVHLWTLLSWYAATGQLGVGSDPLSALLEPLQCYGGLGADGYAREPGEDVPFVCQCYVPYDARLPPNQADLIIGHDPATDDQLLLRVHPHHRSADARYRDYEPLFRLMRHAGLETLDVRIDPLEWHFLGRADATRVDPEVWVYWTDRGRRHESPLLLDATGTAWFPRPDGRRKRGYRLRPLSVIHALSFASVRMRDEDTEPFADLELLN